MESNAMTNDKRKRVPKASQFAVAMAKADLMLRTSFGEDLAVEFKVGGRSLAATKVRISKKHLQAAVSELNAARARVDALFSEPRTQPDAIRSRVSRAPSPQQDRSPFTAIAGGHR